MNGERIEMGNHDIKQIDKNTVPAQNQLGKSGPVYFDDQECNGKRILFVGNSITLHGYKPEIGWHGRNYGMAASAKENDYVHLVMKELRKKEEDAGFCILQAAEWERTYQEGQSLFEKYAEARKYHADVIIIKLGENVNRDSYDEEVFVREYKALLDYLNVSGKSKIIIVTSFWKHVTDPGVLRVGKEGGYETVCLGDLGEDDTMKAIGKFENNGVANHPGDQGMEAIAKRILEALI